MAVIRFDLDEMKNVKNRIESEKVNIVNICNSLQKNFERLSTWKGLDKAMYASKNNLHAKSLITLNSKISSETNKISYAINNYTFAQATVLNILRRL